jgi:amyloid beta precursor protein binding protein 1
MATSDKYDRQLRLWGPQGQRKLMKSHILLIGADAVGTETLKNLVLPGIGNFTVLDDHIVQQSDLGTNFFVEPSSLNKPRAEVVVELLCEMNDDVKGFAKVANFKNLLDKGK